jgi:hypothetical protein
MGFVGRVRELKELDTQLSIVRQGQRADRGVAVLVRGRRRVGKSRLAGEFAQRSDVPHVYFQAARGAPLGRELALFAEAITTSTLPDAAIAQATNPATLTAALNLLAAALPDDAPSIVIMDELPWLLENIDGGAGELQRVWDNRLAKKPVLALLLGSDLAMMEQLTKPDQPFYGRATELVLAALSPRDIATMTGLPPFDAFDAYLATGGLPMIAQEWSESMVLTDFLAASFASSTSALVVSGNRVLDSEFGEATLARQVLSAIGGLGERTFTGIQRAARGEPLNASSLTDTLRVLIDKRIVAADEPLSTKPGGKDRRYRIADPALRFWLAFVEPALAEVDRGRPDLASARARAGYASWRGRAIEPVVREGLERLLPDSRWPEVRRVGGWWPRNNNPEIDLVGADRAPARSISFAGTIKWRDTQPVTAREVTTLATDAAHIPGVTPGTSLVAACPAGAVPGTGLTAVWTANDLLAAWP